MVDTVSRDIFRQTTEKDNCENINIATAKTKMTSQSLIPNFVQRDRKSLQDKTNLSRDAVRNVQKEKVKQFSLSNGKSVDIFVDQAETKNCDKSYDDKAVQTESKEYKAEKEAYDLMVNEEIPETYWKDLAEQRREALDESLHENEMLHKELEELKEENEKLSHIAGQADYFAGVIKELMTGEEEATSESEGNNSSESETEQPVCDTTEKEAVTSDFYDHDDKEASSSDQKEETENSKS